MTGVLERSNIEMTTLCQEHLYITTWANYAALLRALMVKVYSPYQTKAGAHKECSKRLNIITQSQRERT